MTADALALSPKHADEAIAAVKRIDAFVHNFYKADAEKLGELRTASDVERLGKRKKTKLPRTRRCQRRRNQ